MQARSFKGEREGRFGWKPSLTLALCQQKEMVRVCSGLMLDGLWRLKLVLISSSN